MSEVLATLTGVSKTYQKGKEKVEVLHNLDLEIPAGLHCDNGPVGLG
jgi:ABC-type lipoprotein export system ATPase subunit